MGLFSAIGNLWGFYKYIKNMDKLITVLAQETAIVGGLLDEKQLLSLKPTIEHFIHQNKDFFINCPNDSGPLLNEKRTEGEGIKKFFCLESIYIIQLSDFILKQTDFNIHNPSEKERKYIDNLKSILDIGFRVISYIYGKTLSSGIASLWPQFAKGYNEYVKHSVWEDDKPMMGQPIRNALKAMVPTERRANLEN